MSSWSGDQSPVASLLFGHSDEGAQLLQEPQAQPRLWQCWGGPKLCPHGGDRLVGSLGSFKVDSQGNDGPVKNEVRWDRSCHRFALRSD